MGYKLKATMDYMGVMDQKNNTAYSQVQDHVNDREKLLRDHMDNNYNEVKITLEQYNKVTEDYKPYRE